MANRAVHQRIFLFYRKVMHKDCSDYFLQNSLKLKSFCDSKMERNSHEKYTMHNDFTMKWKNSEHLGQYQSNCVWFMNCFEHQNKTLSLLPDWHRLPCPHDGYKNHPESERACVCVRLGINAISIKNALIYCWEGVHSIWYFSPQSPASI